MTATALTLTGRLEADNVLPWLVHRARVLNLVGWVSRVDGRTITMVVWGPPDLVDAMEVASSLGPANALVEHTARAVHGSDQAPLTFDIRHAAVSA